MQLAHEHMAHNSINYPQYPPQYPQTLVFAPQAQMSSPSSSLIYPKLPISAPPALAPTLPNPSNPDTSNVVQQLTAALRQHASGNVVKITEFNNVSNAVSVEFILCTWAAEFEAAGLGEPDMLQIFRKMKSGGNLYEWAAAYQPTT